ncbi:MAG: hypothetical protein WCB85_02975, partial [Candidatus Dormiibacterota bacterium]
VHTSAIRASLSAGAEPGTVGRDLCALRGSLRECWRFGHRTRRPPVCRRPGDHRGPALPHSRAHDRGELRGRFKAFANDQARARGAAIAVSR